MIDQQIKENSEDDQTAFQDASVFFTKYQVQKDQEIKQDIDGITEAKYVHQETNQVRTVKIYNKLQIEESEVQAIKNEILMLLKLEHENILRVYEAFEDDNFIYKVEEHLEAQELFDFIALKSYIKEDKAA